MNEMLGDKTKPCNHFMVWNIQGGYSYYRCSKCNYIDGDKTFGEFKKEFLPDRDEIYEIIENAVHYIMIGKNTGDLTSLDYIAKAIAKRIGKEVRDEVLSS